LPDTDLLIAATAIAHDLCLETNDDHFQRLKPLRFRTYLSPTSVCLTKKTTKLLLFGCKILSQITINSSVSKYV